MGWDIYRAMIRPALVLLFLCGLLIAMTWPYGHWTGLTVGTLVAVSSRRTEHDAVQSLEGADVGQPSVVGTGYLRAHRDDGRRRFWLALAVIAMCAVAAALQLFVV